MAKKLITALVICFFILGATSVARSAMDRQRKNEIFKQVELFSESMSVIESEYVDEVPSRDLIYGAIRGMLASLDPHSQFMDPQDYNELKIETEGKFGGIGIEVSIKDGLLTIITPLEDTPAWKAGLKANDRIVKINNELTRDWTLDEAVKKLRGKNGEAVNLVILRESENKLFDLKIVREEIKIKDIKDVRILQDDIGYIRIVEFRENTAGEFDNAFKSLKKQGMKGLIIDLRNNPGGLLESAVSVTEKFVPFSKMIVYTKGRKASQEMEFISHNERPVTKFPLAVIINEGSASGSEILAGCLQDYKTAVIIGNKSFGKGSVQTVIPLSDGSALKLTTAKYFTPLGRQISNKGIEPDVKVQEKIKKANDVLEEISKFIVERQKVNIAEYQNDPYIMHSLNALRNIREKK